MSRPISMLGRRCTAAAGLKRFRSTRQHKSCPSCVQPQLPFPTASSAAASRYASSSSWMERLRSILVGTNDDNETSRQIIKPKKAIIIDTDTNSAADVNVAEDFVASSSSSSSETATLTINGKKETTEWTPQLPAWSKHWSEEFPPETPGYRRWQTFVSSRRIVSIAAQKVFDPSAIALLGMSASLVLCIGAAEGALLCNEVPLVESMEAANFVARYSLEQLLPSTVNATQEAELVAVANGYDPKILLQDLDPTVADDASTLLALGFCETLRRISAGFMLLAQLVRTGTIGAQAPGIFEDSVKSGKEPPILGFDPQHPGLIVRLCGQESNVLSTSFRRMGRHIFPVIEEPSSKLSYLINQYSLGYRIPAHWSVRTGRYGYAYSWRGFPVSKECLMRTSTGKHMLILEADATNSDDPLALADHALDLELDDASQGFRRIEERYKKKLVGVPFRTLKVYLGNALEIEHSGGGHAFTLRHRVKYSKEIDVLIDSKAPILSEVLRWCDRVTTGSENRSVDGKKIILFQTSSREYFLSVKLLLEPYGFEIRDPLDWHVLSEITSDNNEELQEKDDDKSERSLLGVLNKAGSSTSSRSLQDVARLTALPRLIYYGTAAETVSAVQALVDAGGAKASSCCALLDREDGTRFLEAHVAKDQIHLVKQGSVEGGPAAKSYSLNSGLHIICSSAIYDDLFRQVRGWIRMGYSASDIQKELDVGTSSFFGNPKRSKKQYQLK